MPISMGSCLPANKLLNFTLAIELYRDEHAHYRSRIDLFWSLCYAYKPISLPMIFELVLICNTGSLLVLYMIGSEIISSLTNNVKVSLYCYMTHVYGYCHSHCYKYVQMLYWEQRKVTRLMNCHVSHQQNNECNWSSITATLQLQQCCHLQHIYEFTTYRWHC